MTWRARRSARCLDCGDPVSVTDVVGRLPDGSALAFCSEGCHDAWYARDAQDGTCDACGLDHGADGYCETSGERRDRRGLLPRKKS